MRGKLQILLAIWLLQVVNYIDRVVIGFAGPSMMQSLHMEPKTFGIVLSSFAFGYFLAQIPGGLISDRFGARAVLIIGPLFWALFTGLTGLVVSVAALVVIRLCFGLAEGVSNAATYKVIGDNFDMKGRSQAVAIWVTAFAIAPALTGPAVAMLLTSFGWQSVIMMMALPALLVAAVNFVLIPRGEPVHGPVQAGRASSESRSPFRDVLREPSLWLIASAYGLWNITYWGFLGWMPSYLALERHIDIKASGLLAGVPYIFALVGGLLAGWLGSGPLLRHRPHMLAAVYLLACVSLYLAFVSESLAGSIAALSAAAMFIYAGLATYGTIVVDLAPENARAAYAGIVSTVGQVGGILAPLVIGYLVSETGSFASGFAFMSVTLCIAAVCALALVPLHSKQRHRLLAIPLPGTEA